MQDFDLPLGRGGSLRRGIPGDIVRYPFAANANANSL